ncbi:MAG: c-type cytochrome [Deltaproteobacteria bacterium]|nr:c-type cytochrome [Deltaproteobacteria bacterium]
MRTSLLCPWTFVLAVSGLAACSEGLATVDAAAVDAPGLDATDGDSQVAPDSSEHDLGSPEPLVQGAPVSEFFRNTCGGCHGTNREGGVGPALIPIRLTSPRAFYVDTVTNGRPGTAMPAWSPPLSANEIGRLVDYIFTPPAPGTVVWEMAQIVASRAVIVDPTTLPGAPIHTGNMDNLMLVTERESRTFAVIDGDTHTTLAHVQSSYRSHGYAFDPTNERWVFNMGRDGWLFKTDLYTLQPVIRIRVGIDSRGLAISDDGRFVIAGNFVPGTAVILDAETLMPLQVVHAVGLDMDGEMVESRVGIVSDVSSDLVGPYFIIGLEDLGQVWRIDWSDPMFPIAKSSHVGRTLHDGFLTADNSRFFIAAQGDDWMAAIDVPNWTLVDTIPTGMQPHPGSGAVWTVGGTSYAATVHIGEGKITAWNSASGDIVATIPTAGPGLFIRSHRNSPYVWADAVLATPANEITVFDGASPNFAVVARITDGTQPLHPEPTVDGSHMYIADWMENVVRVYSTSYDASTSTFPLVTTISGIMAPTGIFSISRRAEGLGH